MVTLLTLNHEDFINVKLVLTQAGSSVRPSVTDEKDDHASLDLKKDFGQ